MLFWICVNVFMVAAEVHGEFDGLLNVISRDETCDAVLLGDLRPKAKKGYREIRLTPRSRAARLIDTFAYGSNFELEELLLRFYEMGDEIDEFHIVEGDRDFTGAKKPFYFGEVLESGQLDQWKDKIWHHKIPIPKGMHGYTLQRLQRDLMEEEIGLAQYEPDDVLLAGDLDEVVSRTTLRALKYCQPEADGDEGVVEWNTHIRMSTYMYDLKWTKGNFKLPTTVTFFNEMQRYVDMTLVEEEAPAMPFVVNSFVNLESVFAKPKEIRLRDERPPGWHVSFILNGTRGIAHKYFIRIEDRPEWAKDFKTEAEMENFMNKHFLKNPPDYDAKVFPSNLKKRDFPQAAVEHPEKFPTILRDVVW